MDSALLPNVLVAGARGTTTLPVHVNQLVSEVTKYHRRRSRVRCELVYTSRIERWAGGQSQACTEVTLTTSH